MAKVLLMSTRVLWNEAANAPPLGIVDAVRATRAAGSLVVLVSNHAEPPWLQPHFGDTVRFWQRARRQDGTIVPEIIAENKARYPDIRVSDFVVVGAVDEDMMMAVHGRVLLVRANWATPLGEKMQQYGVPFDQPAALPRVVDLLGDQQPWYFTYASPDFEAYALTNAGTYRETDPDIVALAADLREHLKFGDRIAPGVLLHLLSSVYATDSIFGAEIWGYYPGSESQNDDTELMALLTRLVREPLNRRSAKRGQPLLVRHLPAQKRHLVGGDRADPTGQLVTLHLNPAYRGKIKGKVVAIVDDFLTYGCSFGVAAALLRAAGAKKVIAIAMGKFGHRAALYDIEVTGDPFAPLERTDFVSRGSRGLGGTHVDAAQKEFKRKFGRRIE